MRIIMNNLDKFAYYGGFSGTANYPSAAEIDADTFLVAYSAMETA